jgi:prepilin-type N-terminal cleavage/methylation domain-containing protein
MLTPIPIASKMRPSPPRSEARAFSLVEMLTVIVIVTILMGLAVSSLKRNPATDVTNAAYQIVKTLELARSYAVANHTYTWVGFFEEDPTKGTATQAASGLGRLVISVVASRDGTCIFNEAAAETTATTTPQVTPLDPARLLLVNKLIKLESIHICTPGSVNSTFSQRPGALVASKDRVGLSSSDAPLLFTFPYPLSGTARYTFGIRPAPSTTGGSAPSGSVMFNPQGEVISDAGPVPGVAPCKEIAIQAVRGTTPIEATNVAAIDINGITGIATLYRP